MNISMFDLIRWIIGFLANVGLFYALLVKSRITKFPIFASLIALQIVRTMSLFAVRSLAGKRAYFDTYWSLAVVDYLLQLCLIAEIGRVVLRPSGGVVARNRTRMLLRCGLGVLVAVAIAFAIPTPSANLSVIWDTRVSLVTSLITCQCYLVILGSISKLKVPNRAHVIGIGNGFVLWSAVELFRDGVYAATKWRQEFRSLDELQMIVYIGVTVYWASVLWRDEPKRVPLSAHMIQSAHVRLVSQQPHLGSHDPGKRAS